MSDRVDILALRQANPLAETIERLTGQQSKKNGRNLAFFCPFHSDGEHRSLMVSPDGLRWRCFGSCGTGGDVIDFVAKLRGLDPMRDFLAVVESLGTVTLSQADRDAWKEKRAADERAEAARLAERRASFQAGHSWEKLHGQLGLAQRSYLDSRGVNASWQDYWCLGWTPELWHMGPAFSIPYFDEAGACQTMQYRLERQNDGGKYRFEPDLGVAAFIARSDLPLTGVILVVEGAFKAMVTHVLGTRSKMQVIGLPGQNSDGGICALLKPAERVFFCLDPDSWLKPKKAGPEWEPWPIHWARATGPHARIIQHPTKIDDALLAGWLDSDGLRDVLRLQARTVESYA